jgi:hypothetical protein
MTLFLPRSILQDIWPWTKNVERILRFIQPYPFMGTHLAFSSDYSGDHKGSAFRVYCYLIIDTDRSPDWPRLRRAVRQRYLPDGRRMSFKALGDKRRRRALIPFLHAADSINGHLVSLIVTKEFSNMSIRAGYSDDFPIKLGLSAKWKQPSLEQMFRTAHMFALCISLWSRPRMDTTWITDEDEIVANEQRLDDTQRVAATLVSRYVPHPLGIFAMNTAAIDGSDRAFEDSISICDLAAGMLAEISTEIATKGKLSANRIEMYPDSVSEKSEVISDWFWSPYSRLRRTCILIDRVDAQRLRTQRITMYHL